MKHLLFLFFVFISFIGKAETCSPDRVFIQVPDPEGVLNQVIDIAQDSTGFIWFLSPLAIHRWDGSCLETVKRKETFDHERFSGITADLSGKIWITTSKDLFFLEDGSNKLTAIDSCGIGMKSQYSHFRTVRCSPDGVLWADSEDGYLLKIDLKNNNIQAFRHDKPMIEGEYYYHNLTFGSDGTLWLKGRNLPITRFNPANKQFETFSHPRSDDGCVLETHGHRIWYGPFLFDALKNQFNTLPEFQVKNRIHSICSDHHHRVWMGGSETGLWCYDEQIKTANRYQNQPFDRNTIASNTINKLYSDRDGNLWIATDQGVSMLPFYSSMIAVYKGDQAQNPAFSQSPIQCALERKNGELWFGTRSHGVLTYNFQTKQKKTLSYQLLSPSLSRVVFNREKSVLERYAGFGLAGVSQPLSFESYRRAKFTENNESNVTALFEDADSTVWIGLYNHVGFNRYSDGEGFKRFGLFYQPDYFYPQPLWGANWYMDFAEDRDHHLWVATWEGFGLNLFDKQKGEFSGIHFMPVDRPYDARILHHAWINDSLLLLGGFRYFGIYNTKTDQFIHLKSKDTTKNRHRFELEKYERSSKIAREELPPWKTNIGGMVRTGDSIWFICDGGIGLLQSRSLIFKKVVFKNLVLFETNYPGAIAAGNDRILFCNGDGIYGYNFTKNQLIDYTPFILTAFPDFKFQKVSSLVSDNDEGFYLGTSSGLYHFDRSTQKILKVGNEAHNIARLFFFKGRHWVACFGKTLLLNNNELVPVSEVFTWASTLDDQTVFQISESNHKIWFSTNCGVYCLDSINGPYLLTALGFPDFPVSIDDFIPGKRPDEAFISFNGLFYCGDTGTKRYNSLIKPNGNRLSNRLLSQLFIDSKNHLWIGNTESGIDLLNLKNHHILHFTSENKCRIYDFCESPPGHVWAATSLGLLHFIDHELKDTLFRGEVYSVKPDLMGNIWMCTAKGLVVSNPAKEHPVHIDQTYETGFAGTGKAALGLKNGKMLFVDERNFALVDPLLVECQLPEPKIIPERLKINGSDQSFRIGEGQTIRLRYDQNSFTVLFSTLCFYKPSQVTVAYKIKAGQKDWQYLPASGKQIRFESLQPGKYRFCLMTVDEFLNPLNKPVDFSLEIIPPFWKRIQVQVSLLILLLLVIAGVYFYRERHARLREIRMQQIIDSQTKDLRDTAESLKVLLGEREKFFGIISHDLKNPIKGMERVLASLQKSWHSLDENNRQRLFDELCQAAQGTSGLLDHLLLWSSRRQNLLSPRFEPIVLSELLSELASEQSVIAASKHIAIKVEVDETITINSDREMLKFIVRNLLANAIKYSFEESSVSLMAETNEGKTTIAVSDQGIGMSEALMTGLFQAGNRVKRAGTNQEQGTGMALMVVGEFAERLGARISVDSKENEGTVFKLEFNKHDTNN